MSPRKVTSGRLQAIRLLALGMLSFMSSVPAQQRYSPEIREFLRRQNVIMDVTARAREVLPRRRDEPLRDINISDEEIREIQLLVRDVLPRAIVNIGPVVTGCPCEEGARCTEQVYIQANSAATSVGLLLSRSRNRWSISEVQKWWLRWHAFEAVREKMSFAERDERTWQLVQNFPVCTREARAAENGGVASHVEPRK